MTTTRVLLTFDVEDTKSSDALRAMEMFLSILEESGLTGIFFITGEMANELSMSIVSKLRQHEIGYHTSVHSGRPTLLEQLDLRDFHEAVKKSIEIESEGCGLPTLRHLFHRDITKFRAPRMCWSPAHIVALRGLGIRSDFSADFSEKPIKCNGVVFYPSPIWVDTILRPGTWARFFARIVRGGTIVVALHPSKILYSGAWDWESLETTIGILHKQRPNSRLGVAARIVLYRLFFWLIRTGASIRFIQTETNIYDDNVELLNPASLQLSRVYQAVLFPSMKFVNYHPKYWMSHLETFIGFK